MLLGCRMIQQNLHFYPMLMVWSILFLHIHLFIWLGNLTNQIKIPILAHLSIQALQLITLPKPPRLIWCTQLHPKTHSNPVEKIRVTIIRKRKNLMISQAPRPKKTMLRVNPNERPNILAWFVKRIISPNIVLISLKSINISNEVHPLLHLQY